MVPDGLAGERVDVGVSRMLGLSRSRAAELIDAGLVEVGGTAPARSTRLEPGAMLSVELPEEKPVAEVRPMIAEGMSLVHQDDDLVVIDKPVGVAARSEEHTSELQSRGHLVCRLLLE